MMMMFVTIMVKGQGPEGETKKACVCACKKAQTLNQFWFVATCVLPTEPN